LPAEQRQNENALRGAMTTLCGGSIFIANSAPFESMATQALAQKLSTSDRSKPLSQRLTSVDVYRGLMVAGMILVDNPGSDDLAYGPIKHAEWNGWTCADFIFPSFVFLVGVSMAFSFAGRMQRGESRGRIFLHVVLRSLILIAIGFLVNASPLVGVDWHTFRIYGVTQRIALCYLAAGILMLWSNWRGQLIALLACLVGYWTILRFVPVPGFGLPGHDIPFMDPERNIVAWLDRKLLMGRLYNTVRDPEGLLSTIPAIGTMLMGVLTGEWLRSGANPRMKVLRMAGVGMVGLVAGLVWNRWFPINKNLWTSSFVLLTGGFALVFLGLLYWAIEIKNWRGWTMPLLVFGMNAIVGFVADSVVYGPGYTFTVRGANGTAISWHEAAQSWLVSLGLGAANASLFYSVGAVLFCWALLWLLWRKRIFIKI
jgi:predicted acyltransferase